MPASKSRLPVAALAASGRHRIPLLSGTALAFLAGLAVAPSGIQAQITWSGVTDTDWTVGTNWVGDAAPGAADQALIDAVTGNAPTIGAVDSITVDSTVVNADTLTVDGGLSVANGLTIGAAGTVVINGVVTGDVGSSGQGANTGTINGGLTVSDGSFINSGAVTGATTLDGGALTLNAGSNLADGQTLTVNGGTLNVNASDTVGTLSGTGGTINFGADGVLTTNTGGAPVFGGNITGATTLGAEYLVKDGAGTLTLSGNNTTTGAGRLRVEGGTLVLQGGNAVGDNNTLEAAVGTIELEADESAGVLLGLGTGTVNLNANTLTLVGPGEAADADTSVNVIGTGGITINAPGLVQRFDAPLAYTGATTVTDGTFQLGGNDIIADASAVVINGGTLDLPFFNDTVASVNMSSGSITGTGTLTTTGNVDLSGGTVAATLTAGGTTTIAGGITTVTGTITGDVTVGAGGTLRIAANNAIGGTITTTGSVIDYADGVNTAAPIVIASDTTQVQVNAGTATQSGVISEDAAGRPLEKIGAGTLILAAANTYTGTTTITAGTLALAGGAAIVDTGAVVVAGGATLRLDAGETIGSLAGAGAVNLQANTLTIAGGAATTHSGVISGTGGLSVSGGSTELTGASTYSGGTTVSGGTLIVSGAGTLGANSGTTSVSGGTLTVNSAVTQGSVNLSAGTIDGTGTLTTGGLAQTGGTIDAGLTLDAARTVIAIGGTATASATGLAGTNSGAGTVTATTTAAGAVNNGAGVGISVSTAGAGNTGAVTVTTAAGVTGTTDGIAAEAGATGDVTVTAGGDVTGTTGGGIAARSENATLSVTVDAGATVTGGTTGIETNAAGGTATVNNSGTVRADGAANDVAYSALGSGVTAFNNLGTGAAFGMIGSSALSGAVTIDNAGAWTLNANGTSVMAGANDTLTNSGTFNASAGSSLTGIETFTNTGTVSLGAGATLGAATMTNVGGTINAPGTATLVGNVDNGGGTISLMNGAANSVLNVTGNLSGVNSGVQMEVDLTVPDGGLADLIAVTGNATGSMNMTLTSVGGLAEQTVPVTLLSAADVSGLTVTATSATPGFEIGGGGLFIYNVVPNLANTEIQLVGQINPGAAGVASNLTVVQALIGSVINRPSSAFVGGLAADTDDNCSPGAWARALGGSASGTAFTFNGTNNVPGTVRASYGGLQGGFDFGCFNAFEGGWDIVGGISFGVTDGSTTQNIFALDGMGNPVGPPTSTNRSKFNQNFAGAYLAFARGDWFGDVQMRGERTKFTINNPALNLNNSTFSNRTSTVSASLSRAFAMDGGLTFVPTGGFAVNRSKGGTLTFTDVPASTLVVDDHTGKIAFLGATLARTSIGEAGDSATNQFVTATVYNDFSKARTSTFNPGGGGAPIAMRTGNLGTFGELSVGLSYLKLIDPQSATPAKQFDASVRVDARYSSRVEGLGVTAQMRFQF